MKIEFSPQIFEKDLNIKYLENPSPGLRVVPCGRADGQTDMTKLIIAFRKFLNGSKKRHNMNIFNYKLHTYITATIFA